MGPVAVGAMVRISKLADYAVVVLVRLGAGAIETAPEVPLLLKTTAARYAALEAAIRARHPYELPEIVAVPVERGLDGYLAWVGTETRPVSS